MTFKLCNLSAYDYAQKKNNLLDTKLAELEQLNLEPIELQHQQLLAWKEIDSKCPEFADYCSLPENIAIWLYNNVEGFCFDEEGIYGKEKQELVSELAAIALEYKSSNPQLCSIISEINQFLQKHPIIFAEN
ncbi:MAG: hypothetical protein ACFBSE_22380 [Prochloraceae cyanobacterium]